MFETDQHDVLHEAADVSGVADSARTSRIAGRPLFAQLPVAAIIYGSQDDLAGMLSGCVRTLRESGVKVAGLLQHFGKCIAVGKREMRLEVLLSGDMIRLNDQRGAGVQGCILDADALTRAAMAFRQATLAGPDLLLASRFGRQEAAGGGMRAELAEALIARIPMLVPVRRGLLPALSEFLGDSCQALLPRREAVLQWAAGHRDVANHAAESALGSNVFRPDDVRLAVTQPAKERAASR